MNTHYCTWEYDFQKRKLKGTFEEIEQIVHFMRHVSPMKRDNITGPTPIAPNDLDKVASQMLAALNVVRDIIMDGAQVGFVPTEGDWAERLFASQAITKAAVDAAKAEGVE
jgi:hypothetical protein